MTTTKHLTRLAVLGFGLTLAALPAVRAEQTDLATAPLFTSTTTKVKPNVMFTLDDSGSMAWDFMPDDADFNTSSFNSRYGRRAAQCNGLGYVPASVVGGPSYDKPVTASDTGATTATMGSAADASTAFLSGSSVSSGSGQPGYLGSGDVNLTTSIRAITSPSNPSVVGSGSVTVTVSGASSGSYYPGMVVSVFGSTTDSRGNVIYSSNAYMIGKVSSWNSSQLVINVAMSVGSGSLSAPYVGVGSPIDNVYYTYSGSQAKMAWAYPGNTLTTSSTFYRECNSAIGSDPGKSVFTANIVTPSSAEAQRYANWYYYYSTRMRMMKTSLSRAFRDLGDDFRIGLSTINEGASALPTLQLADFGKAQKIEFFSQVSNASPGGNTPLRMALSKIGKYYANKLTGQADPVQYSCQKNFNILSTDGYWNSTAGSDLAGNAIGNQDSGATTRPMYDGGTSTSRTTRTWTVTETGTRTAETPRTTVSTVTTRVTQTVTTPHTVTTYRKQMTAAISSASRCSSGSSPCTITINTSTSHGYVTGDSITINASNNDYDGTYSVTVVDANTFTFTKSSRPSSPNGISGTVAPQSNSCSTAGQGRLVTTVQTYTSTDRTPTDTTVTTTTPSTSTTVYNITRSTPMTQVITVVNGQQQSDTTTAGTATVTVGSTISGPTVVTGTTTNSSASSTGTTTTTNTTPVTSSGYPRTDNCSAGAAPADTDVAGTGTTTNSASSQVGTSGPTTTNGTVVNTDVYTTSSPGTVSSSTTNSTSGGSSDSLADVAMYYYKTDLRDAGLSNCTGALGTSVCDNNIKGVGEDSASWQHMSTFTLSLGMSGTLTYDPNYQTQPAGDYRDIVLGNKNWPVPSSDGGAVNIDDLWHAAVNGRGRYFSATDPNSLAASLTATLNTISGQNGSSSAAATSTLQPVEGNDGVFIAQFTSNSWVGDLKAYHMNTKTGAVPISALDAAGNKVDLRFWSAAEQLTPTTTRNIYYFKPGAGNAGTLRPFSYANLTADGMNGLVDNACGKSPSLSQCTGLTATQASSINSGANMVSFLAGQAQTQYRTRTQVLGDIVNSSPVYVGAPGFNYTENGYAAFKTAQAARGATLYVGANDGMLHAFNASNGQERWAYIPGIVMPRLYMLGDAYYESKHQYFVDGTPVVGDIYDGTKWRTILVGGLNGGGKGYYALDVTDPANPVALWEFQDSQKMGYSFGNPIITKRRNGTWIVAFTSGYNNADGGGHLFVLNAVTGQLLTTIDTGEGSSGSPSGLGKLNAWVDFDSENLVKRFYAGDLLGNVWRFDIDGYVAPENSAFKLAQLLVEGRPQPITTQIQLAEIESNHVNYQVVYVGTGRYLGRSDVGNTELQSVYAIKDTLGNTSLGDVRPTLLRLTASQQASDSIARTISSSTPIDWAAKNGWYVDLGAGERVNVDMQLAFNMLTVAGNLPGTTATDCTEAGNGISWLYQLNVISGTGTADKLSSMVAGLATVQLATGKGVTVVTKTDVSEPLPKTVDPSIASAAKARRSSWRELAD
ncbi:pilus assembly protein [Roseateles violae]|uniref:PilC/PilY family type IV pilus protein n=1 Tax=Roseateles violae TaxID=3058042 RepID=A0ABT8DSQ1_9BURK|nr:PilC/PilY family type IV pilus protein [Pelomonas sp. PFR6]MDN3921113.1 PilC/PilY family type IV pilus protein [Pelomonas sp. PFR6]